MRIVRDAFLRWDIIGCNFIGFIFELHFGIAFCIGCKAFLLIRFFNFILIVLWNARWMSKSFMLTKIFTITKIFMITKIFKLFIYYWIKIIRTLFIVSSLCGMRFVTLTWKSFAFCISKLKQLLLLNIVQLIKFGCWLNFFLQWYFICLFALDTFILSLTLYIVYS